MDPDLLEALVHRLATAEPAPLARNPYRDPDLAANLATYLRRMAALRPSLLLVGEAPGYRGCGTTGIPFTSEAVLARVPFFRELDLRRPLGRPAGEATATIVWSYLAQVHPPPLLWNAYPFHPHRPGTPRSNRRPSAAELADGESYLLDLVAIFAPQRIAAVGRLAEKGLNRLSIPHVPLRHPSHGGKIHFLTGLARLTAAS